MVADAAGGSGGRQVIACRQLVQRLMMTNVGYVCRLLEDILADMQHGLESDTTVLGKVSERFCASAANNRRREALCGPIIRSAVRPSVVR